MKIKLQWILFLIFTLSLSSEAFGDGWRMDTPWGEAKGDWPEPDVARLAVNPLAYVNPTGVPTAQDYVEFAIKNPDQIGELINRPLDAVYAPVVAAIIAGRNAVLVNGGLRIPSGVRNELESIGIRSNLLDGVRWTTNWNALQNAPQAWQMFASRETKAITLVNTIVFRTPSEADDLSIWVHELKHVEQYADWGVSEFAKRWTDNSSDSGPVEGPAYEAQNSYVKNRELLSREIVRPIPTGSECFIVSPGVAYCDLWASNSETTVLYRVSGEACATSGGTRSGSMVLALSYDRKVCNKNGTAVVKVDNATILKGEDYDCEVRLGPGESKRVTLVAPNHRADASFIAAFATRLGWALPRPNSGKACPPSR